RNRYIVIIVIDNDISVSARAGKEEHMFGRRFAYQMAEGDRAWGRGWPHGRHGGRGHGRHGRGFVGWHPRRSFVARGSPIGPVRPCGPEGPCGEEGFPGLPGRGRRFFGRGDLKFALLELLQERPMHGYEMMKALQERSGGMYSASPGSVYPTLQMLEDRDFVTVSEVDGKKVYTITDAGRAFLAENQPEEHRWHGRHGWHGFWQASDEDWTNMAALAQELREFGPLAGHAIRSAARHPEKLKRLRDLLARLRAELQEIASDSSDADG